MKIASSALKTPSGTRRGKPRAEARYAHSGYPFDAGHHQGADGVPVEIYARDGAYRQEIARRFNQHECLTALRKGQGGVFEPPLQKAVVRTLHARLRELYRQCGVHPRRCGGAMVRRATKQKPDKGGRCRARLGAGGGRAGGAGGL